MTRFLALGALFLLAFMGGALAQGVPLTVYVVPTCGTGTSGYVPTQNRLATMDTTGKLCTSGTGGGGSTSGFTPNGNYTSPLLVSTSSAPTALPQGDTIAVSNTGTLIAYVNLGTSNGVVATTSSIPVQPGSTVGLTVGANTFLAAITGSGTTTLNLSGGTGLVTGFGGGGSGGGGISPTAVFVVSSGALDISSPTYGVVLWNSATTAPKSESIYLCDSSSSGRQLIIKDQIGTAATYAVTLTPVAGTIDGSPTYIMNFNFQSVNLLCGGAGNWSIQ